MQKQQLTDAILMFRHYCTVIFTLYYSIIWLKISEKFKHPNFVFSLFTKVIIQQIIYMWLKYIHIYKMNMRRKYTILSSMPIEIIKYFILTYKVALTNIMIVYLPNQHYFSMFTYLIIADGIKFKFYIYIYIYIIYIYIYI